jgi:hypothetical protein
MYIKLSKHPDGPLIEPLHLSDLRHRRAYFAPIDQSLERIAVSFSDELHGAIPAIPNPTGEPELNGSFPG